MEFGAGTGILTHYLQGKFSHLEASDAAPNMVKAGQQHFPDTHWTQRDAWHPRDEQHSWSFLASCSLLQWATNPEKVLRKWKEILKPNGRHLSGIYVSPSLPEIASLLPHKNQFRWRTADEWRTAFTRAGFNILRSETKTCRYVYPDALTLFRRLHGTGAKAIENPLPLKEFKRLLRDYESQFACDEGVSTTWTFLRIETTV